MPIFFIILTFNIILQQFQHVAAKEKITLEDGRPTIRETVIIGAPHITIDNESQTFTIETAALRLMKAKNQTPYYNFLQPRVSHNMVFGF